MHSDWALFKVSSGKGAMHKVSLFSNLPLQAQAGGRLPWRGLGARDSRAEAGHEKLMKNRKSLR